MFLASTSEGNFILRIFRAFARAEGRAARPNKWRGYIMIDDDTLNMSDGLSGLYVSKSAGTSVPDMKQRLEQFCRLMT